MFSDRLNNLAASKPRYDTARPAGKPQLVRPPGPQTPRRRRIFAAMRKEVTSGTRGQ